MKNPCTAIVISFAIAWMAVAFVPVHADENDDHVKQACTGLSLSFYNGGSKDDALDEEITTEIAMNRNVATLIKRAQLTGAAQACGQQISSAMNRLDVLAASQFSEGSVKASRFVQIINCTEARFERFGIARWASQKLCPQTQQYFENYVLHEQPILPN